LAGTTSNRYSQCRGEKPRRTPEKSVSVGACVKRLSSNAQAEECSSAGTKNNQGTRKGREGREKKQDSQQWQARLKLRDEDLEARTRSRTRRSQSLLKASRLFDKALAWRRLFSRIHYRAGAKFTRPRSSTITTSSATCFNTCSVVPVRQLRKSANRQMALQTLCLPRLIVLSCVVP
jgi:hypothetical protein